MFTITKEAIHALLAWSGEEKVKIRYSITTPCCNERKYDLRLTATVTDQDAEYTCEQIQIIYHPADLPYLKGTKIDYRDGGFFIHHPHPLVQPF